jgi:hypothetical protein
MSSSYCFTFACFLGALPLGAGEVAGTVLRRRDRRVVLPERLLVRVHLDVAVQLAHRVRTVDARIVDHLAEEVSGMVWDPAPVGRKNSSYVAIVVSPAAS